MDKKQFISYVETTQEALRRFLVALCCGDNALADDIAQETYIKAYLSCDTIASVSKFKAWLFRIGYTTFIDFKRSSKVSADVDEAAAVTSDYRADASFRYQQLYAALDLLPPKERTSVLLHYLEGYSVKEVAEIVGTTSNAVKQHLLRGRTHLRGLLSDVGR